MWVQPMIRVIGKYTMYAIIESKTRKLLR